MANAFAFAAKDTEDGSESGSGFHAQSLAILGEIALSENKPKLALSHLEKALTVDLGDLSVDALYNSARAKEVSCRLCIYHIYSHFMMNESSRFLISDTYYSIRVYFIGCK